MREVANLVGEVSGWLTVTGKAYNHYGRRGWKCRCRCGNVATATTEQIRNQRKKSCGCYHRRNRALTIRRANMRRRWSGMIDRCHNKTHAHYRSYGGRGISVCERWLSSFSDFLADVGYPPEENRRASIDRIDNDGNYEPGNVRWATAEQQANNKQTSVLWEVDGERLTMAQWAKRLGVGRGTLWSRVHLLDKSVEDAVKVPIRHRKKRSLGVVQAS